MFKPFIKRLAANPAIPSCSYSGTQLFYLYNMPTITPRSRKVTIAIVVAYHYANLLKDLTTYWKSPSNFGVSATPPKVNVYSFGKVFDDGWAQESCLDLQIVCTMNPNANIWVVEAASSSYDDMMRAVTYASNTIKADVLSMSWGDSDNTSTLPYNNVFTNTSVCYCAASGDSNTVSWPAVSPNCLAVGGTTLLWTPNKLPTRTEFTWYDGYAGTGCGYSKTLPQPNYQKKVIPHRNRVIPDVSLLANPYTGFNMVYAGQWTVLGGTSLSAPLFAAFLSLVNQNRINQGKKTLTTVYSSTPNVASPLNYTPLHHVQTYLYSSIYGNASYNSSFNDVTIGNGGSTGVYSAGTKFDIPTGLGSPNCTALCTQLTQF